MNVDWRWSTPLNVVDCRDWEHSGNLLWSSLECISGRERRDRGWDVHGFPGRVSTDCSNSNSERVYSECDFELVWRTTCRSTISSLISIESTHWTTKSKAWREDPSLSRCRSPENSIRISNDDCHSSWSDRGYSRIRCLLPLMTQRSNEICLKSIVSETLGETER